MALRLLPPSAATCAIFGVLLHATAAPVRAGQDQSSYTGLPAVVTRLESGEVTLRAFRIKTPINLDGHLDDEAYRTVDPRGGFLMQEPQDGLPATEPTDIWVFFDDVNLYVSARCWDSHPELAIANVNELRRDANTINAGENISVVFDTFQDRRNGFFFATNPLGAMRDQAVIAEAQDDDWNTVWDVRAAWFDRGWTMEMVIPFKSLRYRSAGPQVWGINFRRISRWKNEFSYLTRVPPQFGLNGVFRVGLAATLVGLETPAQSMNLEVKPYAVSSVTTDRAAAVPFENDFKANGGVDIKYGLTRGLIADATFNTDFAQVEEDVQQVNLTRFSLFFPEKRTFFLEGQGIFGFGGVQFNNFTAPGDVPVLFFSRRIGLSQGQSVPVVAGGRITGKVGRFTIGALNIQTGDKEEAGAVDTNFSVARVKWDFLRRSNVGVLATRRSPTAGDAGTNVAFGADAALLLTNSVEVNAYYALTDSPGSTDGQSSYRGRFEYNSDRYGAVADHLLVGAQFNPEIGFVRRTNFRRNIGSLRFSPRPSPNDWVRKLTWQASIEYITDAARTTLENRTSQASFSILFENSDQFTVDHTREYELLPEDFTVGGVVVPVGGYDYHTTRISYSLGQQRKVSGRLSTAWGTFYGGTKREATYSGRSAILTRFAVEPGVTLNWVDLPSGSFEAKQLNCRFIITPSPRMVLSSLVQYNALSHLLSSSARLRWEYTPGSELFVVYSDGRDTATRGLPDMMNRSFALKITRLVRF
jgi:hypothetical protein